MLMTFSVRSTKVNCVLYGDINIVNVYIFHLLTRLIFLFSLIFAASLEKEASFMQSRMLALEPRIEVLSNDIKVIQQDEILIHFGRLLIDIYLIEIKLI